MINNSNFGFLEKILMLSLVFIIGFSTSSFAQLKIYGKITTPENKKYHGEVITYEPQETVTMNCQGETMTFDLIKNKFKFTTRKAPKPYIFPDGVGYHRISIGALTGRPNDGSFLSYSYHFQKNSLIGYGGGLAYENYGDNEGYNFIVPRAIFLSYLQKTNATPFVKIDAGYGIAIKSTSRNQTKAKGGYNLGAAIGYRLSTNRVMVDFTLGTRLQTGDYTFDTGDFIRVEENLFKRVEFGIGFMW